MVIETEDTAFDHLADCLRILAMNLHPAYRCARVDEAIAYVNAREPGCIEPFHDGPFAQTYVHVDELRAARGTPGEGDKLVERLLRLIENT